MLILLGILAGIGLPIQTSLNNKLRKKLGSPYIASLISFIVALIFLQGLLIITKQNFIIPFELLMDKPLWIWSGGICGVIFLTGNILLFSKLGSVQAVILPVMGQILMGLIIDNFGFFYSEQIKLTMFRIGGAIFVIIGVAIISVTKEVKKAKLEIEIKELEEELITSIKEDIKIEKENKLLKYEFLMWRTFGVVAGMLSATQIAINGYLGKIINSPIKASSISFSIGVLLLIIICIVGKVISLQNINISKSEENKKYPYWTWFGGILGGVYILANIFLAGTIGTGMTVIVLLVGATIGGLLIDNFGFFDSEIKAINGNKILGVILMIIGAIAIKLF